MYILEIAVFNIKKELSILSYWTMSPCNIGDLVEISIGKRIGKGIILSVADMNKNKLFIRKSDFQLKKINKIIKKQFISERIINILQNIASKNALSISDILDNFLSEYSLQILSDLSIDDNNNKSTNLIIYYPTILELNSAYEDFQKYIIENNFSDYKVYKLHSDLTEKRKQSLIENLHNMQKSIILSTPSLLPSIVKDASIILASSESKHYVKNFNNKRLNTKGILIDFYTELGRDIIMTDNIISVGTMYNINNRELELLNKEITNKNKTKNKKIYFINRDKEKKDLADKNIKTKQDEYILSPVILDIIEERIKNKEKIIIWNLRKGDWTSSVCKDCGEIVKCHNCDTKLVYYDKDKYYFCPKEKIKYNINTQELFTCSYCGGWRIEMLGITTGGLYNYFLNKYKNTNIYIIDSDNTKTDRQIINKYNEWKEDGGILIGNESLLNILNISDEDCDIVISSIDSLFYINDYIIDEEIFKLIQKFHIRHNIYIQSREYKSDNEDNILSWIRDYNTTGVADKILQSRENNNLPPYSYLLTFTYKDKSLTIISELSQYKIHIIKKAKDYEYLIFIDRDKWDRDQLFRNSIIKHYLQYNLNIRR